MFFIPLCTKCVCVSVNPNVNFFFLSNFVCFFCLFLLQIHNVTHCLIILLLYTYVLFFGNFGLMISLPLIFFTVKLMINPLKLLANGLNHKICIHNKMMHTRVNENCLPPTLNFGHCCCCQSNNCCY